MHSFGNIGARTVILACEDEFLCIYLTKGLRQLGMNVVAPARSLTDLLDLAAAEPIPPLACISVNLPGVSPTLEAELAERQIPYMLFGLPWPEAAWSTAALTWPFSAYQLAQDLHDLLRRTAIASVVPPWSDDPIPE